MDLGISGRTALITGASKGIGASAAEVLHGLGANVVLMARGQAAIDTLAAELGEGRTLAVAGDVGDYAAVRGAVEQAGALIATAPGPFMILRDVLAPGAGCPDLRWR